MVHIVNRSIFLYPTLVNFIFKFALSVGETSVFHIKRLQGQKRP